MSFFAIGIDPGSRNCGIASLVQEGPGLAYDVVEETTIIASAKLSGRAAIEYILDEILQCHLVTADLFGIESFDYQGHSINHEAHDTYLLVGALGELRHRAPVVWLRPIEWKQGLSGQKSCSDHQLRMIINLRLGLPQKHSWSSEHALDAAGIALVAADRYLLAQTARIRESELRGGMGRPRRK